MFLSISSYLSSQFNPESFGKLLGNIPGNIAQGLIWGIMALGVFITFRMLDVADLTVDGSFTTGAAVTVMLKIADYPMWFCLLIALFAGVLAGFVTGLLHTKLGIPAILAGILSQIALYSINLRIMGRSNVSFRFGEKGLFVTGSDNTMSIFVGLAFVVVIIILLYWYFGTEHGSALRATGSNYSMANAQGININNMKLVGLALSNGLVALSGGLNAQLAGGSD
ncbi:MAG: ABC transporter permease, partial [Ruminococcus sp.]|nr:ABC transporter permease [Ruminococcus sp.]